MELCCSAFSFSFLPKLSSFSPHHSISPSSSFYKTQNSLSRFLQFSLKTHTPLLASPSSTSSSIEEDVKKDKLPAELDVQEFKLPNSSVRLSVTVPQAVCNYCYQRVLKEAMKEAKIRGFRQGNIPENIILGYYGKESVRKATIESILKRTIPHAMQSVDGKALKDSIKISSKFSDLEERYNSSDSLTYDILVDVFPEVRWTPEDGYKNLKIIVEIDTEITAEVACEREFKRRYKTLAPLRIVTDRGLQVGDVVIVDISATTLDQNGVDGESIPSAESKGFQFDTEDGDILIPGFLDSIIGIRAGETKSFPLVFPESWRQEDLRDVQAQFTVECKELFYRDLPPLNDSLSDKLISGLSTLDEVKEALLEKCRQLEQTAKDQATDNAILDQLRKMIQVDIPQSLMEEEGRQMLGTKLLEVQARMKLNDEQLASLTSQKMVDEYIEHEKENIVQVIKQNLAVGDIYKREKLEVETDEVVKEVANSINEFKKHNQEYDEDRIKEQVQEVLEGAKVLEWLRENAEVQYITK